MIKKIRGKLSDPLYQNTVYIMLNAITGAAFGFFFWMIAAKLYSKEDVGVATALISSIYLLLLFSRMGLDNSMIKFLPKGDKNKILGTTLLVSTFSSIVLGIVYIMGIDYFSPGLNIIKEPLPSILFLGCVVAVSCTSTLAITFIAIRNAKNFFWQSIILGLRIPVLFFLISLKSIGILTSLGMAYALAFIFLLVVLIKSNLLPTIAFDKDYLKKSFRFSTGNYISSILLSAPTYILPIIVLETLGAESTAYYYIAYTIASILFLVPSSVGTSMFVEGSHGEAIKKTTIKSLKTIFVMLVPGILILFFFGGFLLHLVGKDYSANAENLIRIFALSSVFVTISSVYFSIKKIQGEVKDQIVLSGLIALLLPLTSYYLMKTYGIDGVGYAWIISYGIVALIIAVKVKRNKWI
jgi:O-antigen/teichoic acid export membrane protein